MTLKLQFMQSRILGIAGGITGAIAMSAASSLTISGPLQAAPLIIVLITVLIMFLRLRPKASFRQLTALSLKTSLITMLLFAAYVRLIVDPQVLSISDYMSMLGIVAIVSGICSLVTAGLMQLLRS